MRSSIVALVLSLVATGCGGSANSAESTDSTALPISISNVGDSSLEGHTPQGFSGSGTGLFAGDNLNANFPEGEGIQIFLAFELPEGVAGVAAAELRSDVLSARGTPFEDLGTFRSAPVQFEEFSRAVFDTDTIGDAVACSAASSSVSCEVTDAVNTALSEGRTHVQLRLRFDTPGDGDGQVDLARFFLTDANTNEPGIFTLTLS